MTVGAIIGRPPLRLTSASIIHERTGNARPYDRIVSSGRVNDPPLHWIAYISGSMPRTGWFFSVNQFSSSSQSEVMVSSAM